VSATFGMPGVEEKVESPGGSFLHLLASDSTSNCGDDLRIKYVTFTCLPKVCASNGNEENYEC
jgi:hypothetical protein